MTNEELKNMLFIIDTLLDDAITDSTRQKVKDTLTEVCKLAIKALEQQPSEDCISRQKALDCFEQTNTRQGAKYAIKTLPPVTPKYTDEEIDKIQEIEQAYVDKMVELAVEETKRPKGKWIDDCGGVKCSCCGYSIDDDHYAKAYCTNCGAYMGGGEDG